MTFDKMLAVLYFALGWACIVIGGKALNSKNKYRYFGLAFIIPGLLLVSIVVAVVLRAAFSGAS